MLHIRKALIACLLISTLTPAISFAQDEKPAIKVIDPDKRVASANPAALDTEHFEAGVYTGFLSVEDFNTNPLWGFSARYYFNQKLLIEASIATSETERANPEGTLDFNPERDFSYVSISAGYQLLKGRSFWGKKRKFNSGLYALAGVEQVDFADESNTGLLLGISYKTVLTDWLTINLDFKNHIVERNFVGDDKVTQNTEFAIGINTIF